MKCTSCGIEIMVKENFVRFFCPNCGNAEIVRCSSCKKLNIKYICPNKACNFTGP